MILQFIKITAEVSHHCMLCYCSVWLRGFSVGGADRGVAVRGKTAQS